MNFYGKSVPPGNGTYDFKILVPAAHCSIYLCRSDVIKEKFARVVIVIQCNWKVTLGARVPGVIAKAKIFMHEAFTPLLQITSRKIWIWSLHIKNNGNTCNFWKWLWSTLNIDIRYLSQTSTRFSTWGPLALWNLAVVFRNSLTPAWKRKVTICTGKTKMQSYSVYIWN